MKKTILSSLLCILFLMTACKKEDVQMDKGRPTVQRVTVLDTVRVAEPQEFWIKFEKPTPCHKSKKVNVSLTGLTVSYDVMLYSETNRCQAIYTSLDSVQVAFTPQQTGEHTLNFLLNNRLYLVKKVFVRP